MTTLNVATSLTPRKSPWWDAAALSAELMRVAMLARSKIRDGDPDLQRSERALVHRQAIEAAPGDLGVVVAAAAFLNSCRRTDAARRKRRAS